MRKKYILLKDSPELKKGAIVEEMCDDGDQDFECSDRKFIKMSDSHCCNYSRKTVMDNPEWFEEVILIPVSKSQEKKALKLIKNL